MNFRRRTLSASRSPLVCSSHLSDQRRVCVSGVRDGRERAGAGLPNLVLEDRVLHETDDEGTVVLECDSNAALSTHPIIYEIKRNISDTSWKKRRGEVGL